MKTDNILIAGFYAECHFEDRGNGWYSKIPSGKWASPRDEKTNALFNKYPLSNGESIKYMVYEPLLKFHISWDWLMPVVEKIETLNYIVKIHQNICIIQACIMGDRTVISKQISNYMESNTKLSNTYKAVVEFIKWYNKNNSNEDK